VVGASPWSAGGPAQVHPGGRLSRVTRTVVDQLTVLALVGALGIVLAVLAPVAWTNWIDPPADSARRGLGRALRARGWAVAPADAAADEGTRRRSGSHKLEQLFPELRQPKRKRGGGSGVELKGMAVTLGPAQLFSEPDDDAEEVIELPSGTVVFIMRESPPWVLVAKTAGSDMVFGWVQRRRLSHL
jgi:hypothetical protein